MRNLRRLLPAVLSTLLTAGLLLAGPPASAEPAPTTKRAAAEGASTYTPRTPVRVLDTRNGTGGVSGPVGAGGTITLDLAAQVPSTTTAVVLNVTAVTPTAHTYVTVFPSGTTRPLASSLNLPPGDTRANQVTVMLGANRRVSLYNNAGATHLVADLAGHYDTGAGARFTALPANRVFDTGRPNGPALGPGTTREVDLSLYIPLSATAVTFNLTASGATAGTFVTAWPAGQAQPTASNVNLPAGETRPNLVTVAVGANRKVSLYNNSGQVHVIVDLTGFYTPDYGASFVPQAPSRVLDTRDGAGTPIGHGAVLRLPLADEVPPTTTGVAMNVTGVDPTQSTYVAALAPPGSTPILSTLNLSAGQTAANAAVVALSGEPTVLFHNSVGTVHVVADLVGVFAVLDSPACTADCAYAWGNNSGWQLGTAQATESAATPAPVVTLSEVKATAGSNRNGYALRTNGTVWAWGANNTMQLGNGWVSGGTSPGGSAVPVPVLGLLGIRAIAAGGESAYALRGDGTVWAWGDGAWGQLGNAFITYTPKQVTGVSDVVAIAASERTAYALRADGTVWAWGANDRGQLGDGSTVQYSTVPVQVAGLTGITAIAGGSDTGYAVRGDGTAWAWGDGAWGQLGNGEPCVPSTPCVTPTPVQVSGLTGVTMVAGGRTNGYALLEDGTVWAWGASDDGRLGNGVDCGDTSPWQCETRVPVQVANVADATRITTFADGGYALRANGTVLAWGDNQSGALGNDGPAYSATPVPVAGLTGVSAIGGGASAGYAVVPNP
jgi:alpha-tubulin suppressor-like RCC1 family protein